MNTMQQAPVAPPKPAPRCAGLMLGLLLCALFQNIISGMPYMANEDYAVIALLYILVVATVYVLIAIGVLNPARRILCVVGFWIYAGTALLELIFGFVALADSGFELDSATSVMTVLQALVGFAAVFLMALWMQLLLGNRKRVKAFVPAIVAGVEMFLFLLTLIVGIYEGDSSNEMVTALMSGVLAIMLAFHVFLATAATLMPFFAGYWMKDQVDELPKVDVYQKMREKFMRPTQGRNPGYGQPGYGQPMQYGQPAYGQPNYGQPQTRPMGGQPNYGQPAYGQPQARPMGGQPNYGQPSYNQPQARPVGGQAQPYGQPAYNQPQTPPAAPAAPASPLEGLGFDDPQINAARPKSDNGFGQ